MINEPEPGEHLVTITLDDKQQTKVKDIYDRLVHLFGTVPFATSQEDKMSIAYRTFFHNEYMGWFLSLDNDMFYYRYSDAEYLINPRTFYNGFKIENEVVIKIFVLFPDKLNNLATLFKLRFG